MKDIDITIFYQLDPEHCHYYLYNNNEENMYQEFPKQHRKHTSVNLNFKKSILKCKFEGTVKREDYS